MTMRHADQGSRWGTPAALAVFILILATGVYAQSAAAQVGPSTPPTRIFGSVSITGLPAPGATVASLIGSTICGTSMVATDGTYQIDVRSAASQAGCGTDGALVTFTVDGRPARESVAYRSGAFIRRDLTVGAPVADVFVERWARSSDEPCANPVDSWCIRTYPLPPAREPFAYYRMLAFLRDGRVEQSTDWIIVEPNVETPSVTSRRDRGVDRVTWERWTLVGAAPCAGRFDDLWCIESVDVEPPITGTVWYRLRVRQPGGGIEDPTGFIPASP
jgi:hypothetical protein